MNSCVKLIICNPGTAIRRETDGTTLVESPEGDSYISVAPDGRVVARRGIVSNSELFYLIDPRRGLIVSDTFRSALAEVPVSERILPESSIVDHFLFRTCPGHSTYCRQVKRLGTGEELRWKLGQKQAKVRIVEKIEYGSECYEPLPRIDEILREKVEANKDAVNLLSGGIDSTLIQTYLDRGHPSVSAGIDLPAFAYEMEYARDAARLTGAKHEIRMIRAEEYSSRLEKAIEWLGMPPHHLQTALIDVALAGPASKYLTGELADALFGLERARKLLQSKVVRRLFREAVRDGVNKCRGQTNLRLSKEGPVMASVVDPFGAGCRFATFADIYSLVREFGVEAVRNRLTTRRDYVFTRISLQGKGHALRHAESGHWHTFIAGDTLSLWRQLASAKGKELVAPFATHNIVALVLSIPPEKRYGKDGEVKIVLKDLLKARLPGYEVRRPKGGSGITDLEDISRGPLRLMLEEYGAIPGLEEFARKCLEGHTNSINWNILTLSIWKKRVFDNPDLRHPATARVVMKALPGNDS